LEGPGSRRHRNGLALDIIELVITETTALALSPAPSNIDTTSLPVLVSPADEAVTQKPRASDSQVNAGVIGARSMYVNGVRHTTYATLVSSFILIYAPLHRVQSI
jgi:hypothetical protein